MNNFDQFLKSSDQEPQSDFSPSDPNDSRLLAELVKYSGQGDLCDDKYWREFLTLGAELWVTRETSRRHDANLREAAAWDTLWKKWLRCAKKVAMAHSWARNDDLICEIVITLANESAGWNFIVATRADEEDVSHFFARLKQLLELLRPKDTLLEPKIDEAIANAEYAMDHFTRTKA